MGIETALVGTALASSTAGASTVGLLGAGGVLGAGTGLGATIGAGLSILGGFLPALSGGLSLLSGVQQQGASSQQAANAIAQGNLQAAENERVAFKQAQQEKEQSESVRRAQKIAFLASGVTLEGSPLLVMEETRRQGSENIDEILRAGQSGAFSARQEGRLRASELESSGRQAFVSGLTNFSRSLLQ